MKELVEQKVKHIVQKVPSLYRLLWKGDLLLKTGSQYTKIFTILDAVKLTLKWADSLPNKFDVIVGVPRSGLTIAGILASKFGRPLSTPNAFVQGEVWHSLHVGKPKFHNVLIVEDDVIRGTQISRAYMKLKTFDPSLEIETASLFVTPKSKKLINYHYMVKKPPLIYEWSLLTNMASLGKLLVDMDGVLCKNPSDGDLKNEKSVTDFYVKAEPHLIPQYTIEAIVTSRLEKYRSQTEAWLKKHDVKYKRLIMLQGAKTFRSSVQLKTEAIRMVKPFWFWESNFAEAIQLWKKTKILTVCVDKMVILR